MIHETFIKVRYVETDQMGVVHHSNYYHWFEVGRTEAMKTFGISYSEVETRGFMLPLIESHCNYKIGAKYEDELIIRTKLLPIEGVKLTFDYEVIRVEDNKLLAKGSTVHTFTNKNFKPINIKKEDEEIYNIIDRSIEKQ